jgi:hypothetical protein
MSPSIEPYHSSTGQLVYQGAHSFDEEGAHGAAGAASDHGARRERQGSREDRRGHLFEGRPSATVCNVWTTEGFPVNNDGGEDAGLRKAGTTIQNGTIFRILEFAPGLAPRNHRTD